MKATELRIGNLIFQSGQITTIENISRSINDWERVNNKRLFDCTPIPLTEEWLLKFGFKRFPWGLVVGNLLFKDNLKCTELTFEVGNGFRVEIKYVHQLQNLYFCLCGKELELSNQNVM